MPTAQYNGLVSSMGVKQRGPSGAPIWAFPMIDEKRNRVIVATGENTSHPATDTSDAIISLDLDTGKVVWKFQAMAQDIWNMACSSSPANSGPNCPWNIPGDLLIGRDYDFGAGVLLAKGADGSDVVLAGQKSGDVWALDPATGKKLWNVRFGQGTSLGGIHWGITTDGQRLFAANNDPHSSRRWWSSPASSRSTSHRQQAWATMQGRAKASAPRRHQLREPLRLLGGPADRRGASSAAPWAARCSSRRRDRRGAQPIDTPPADPDNPQIAAKGGSIDSHAISAGAADLHHSGYGLFSQTAGNALIAYRAKAEAALRSCALRRRQVGGSTLSRFRPRAQ